ncbi:hypothetical protein GWC95_10715 [Sediminibacterium roseum]|uniref:Uncharacterized protein n=1 Tax=Sediminibacterium roseum TaxID=1978412 RepID=A0ABW9ZTG0_9BACT|nr:hypothetical protein [Sediminibacterium roseum]NCI50395.1 hypothetical protein [Sediminibacterium roseum]
MKYILLTTGVILLYVSCKPSQTNRLAERGSREVYVYSFKMTYFKKMLLSGFDNSAAIKTVVASDQSGYSEIVLSMDDFRFIDSVVAADRAKLSADSLAGIGRVAEGAGGKRVFDCALARYESKWLNDAATRRSRYYVDAASGLNQ